MSEASIPGAEVSRRLPTGEDTRDLGRALGQVLRVARWVILDNAERAKVTDGYYAVPYFQDRAERTWLDVITYRGVDGAHPDIVRLEFDWDEVR